MNACFYLFCSNCSHEDEHDSFVLKSYNTSQYWGLKASPSVGKYLPHFNFNVKGKWLMTFVFYSNFFYSNSTWFHMDMDTMENMEQFAKLTTFPSNTLRQLGGEDWTSY